MDIQFFFFLLLRKQALRESHLLFTKKERPDGRKTPGGYAGMIKMRSGIEGSTETSVCSKKDNKKDISANKQTAK